MNAVSAISVHDVKALIHSYRVWIWIAMIWMGVR